jgi:dTDP-4-amino-4,6-dideoxygalactose transaminase
MDLADAVIASDCRLQVYDIDEDFMPLISFLEEIRFKEECVLIIPSFFGACKLRNELMELLEQMEMPIIFDDAQVFPMNPTISGSHKRPWFSVISFGKGKPVSAFGGGALISNSCDGNLNHNIFSDNKLSDSSSCFKDIVSHSNRAVKNAFKNLMGLSNTNLFVDKKTKIFDSLEELVYSKEYRGFTPQRINKLQMVFALKRFYFFKKRMKKRLSINKYFVQIAGTRKEFKYIKKQLSDMNFLPLCIKNEDRYNMLKILGSYGIQCTIFYYPLHQIPFYSKKYDLAECPNSERIFSNILILPYNLDYSNKKVIKMLHLVDKSLKELKRKDV